ncbi:MAG TPA: RNA polymerase sigma factor region1.1 domain-containing protein, partial [Roseiflexaceae bacterium]|nr:RNA polymerase sigma factor region1.1 domain-containing protein [Roseiflexaceae bacterium]
QGEAPVRDTDDIESIESALAAGMIQPFSFADLGLSADEIAALEQGEIPAEASDDTTTAETVDLEGDVVQPFSLSDLGLDDDAVAGNMPLTASDPTSAEQLPPDLLPFSFDDLDASEASLDEAELPSALQPFSLEDTPGDPPRPRLSGLPAEEPTTIEAADDDELLGPRGFSWQEPNQPAETGFARSIRNQQRQEAEEAAEEGSLFNKLKQHRNSGDFPLPEPLPPVPLRDDEHLGLFSLDDVSLRDDDELLPETSTTGSTPADATPAPAEEPGIVEPPTQLAAEDIQPFSLADLGLSDDEIAALGLSPESSESSAEESEIEAPSAADTLVGSLDDAALTTEPEIEAATPPIEEIESIESALSSGALQPFSFADLGLSDDEIAALGLSSEPAILDTGAGATTPEQPAAEAAIPEPTAETTPTEPEIESIDEGLASGLLQPFSFADLGLSDDEVAALDLEPADLGESAAPAIPQEPAELSPIADTDIQPFSLDDLGLEELDELEDDDSRLGLTEEELAGLDVGGDVDWSRVPISSPAAAEESASGGDPAVDQLIALGRRQGFVDIADIIAAVDDPEAEAERIEMIGQMLHEARIEIRDGDEVIDLDAEYADDESGGPSSTAVPETLSRDVAETDEAAFVPFSLSELGLSDDEIAELEHGEVVETSASGSSEPELTPFSLSELGLSDDEIAELGLGESAGDSDAPGDMTPFSLSELGLSDDEIASLGLGDQITETSSQPTESAGLSTFSLSELGLSDEALASLSEGTIAKPSEPAPVTGASALESVPLSELGFSDEEIGINTPPPVASTPPVAPAAREVAPTAEAPVTATGNDMLDEYLQLIESDPQDFTLRLAVARVGVQAGIPDLAIQQYKELIRHNAMLDDMIADIRELSADIDDGDTRRRLYRVLGDAYTKQGRIRDAVQAYGWSGGKRG